MKIVTHNGKFHADDVMTASALLLVYPEAEILRTRDEDKIKSADLVFDVGQIYDPKNNRFDHHQREGAGERGNGIPYSSFGIVWKKYGEEICQSAEVAETIDRFLVQCIDAGDNGKNLFLVSEYGVKPYLINDVIDSYRPAATEPEKWDERFIEAVAWGQGFLKRVIKITKDQVEINKSIIDFYKSNQDKKVLIFPENMLLRREWVNGVLSHYSEPIYAGYTKSDGQWQLLAINENPTSFNIRKPLPEAWRGKSNSELVKESGVEGAEFCHRSGFMCLANDKQAIIKLAEIALNS